MHEILEILISLFKSQMNVTNQLRAFTLIKTLRCNRKMDLLQELESSKMPKSLLTHQLSWAITTATKEAWLKTKALELNKVTNWWVKFITQLRKKEAIPRVIFMLIIIVLRLETMFLYQVLIKSRITKPKNMKKERIQSNKWSKVDLKFLVKLDNDQRWLDLKCWKI